MNSLNISSSDEANGSKEAITQEGVSIAAAFDASSVQLCTGGEDFTEIVSEQQETSENRTIQAVVVDHSGSEFSSSLPPKNNSDTQQTHHISKEKIVDTEERTQLTGLTAIEDSKSGTICTPKTILSQDPPITELSDGTILWFSIGAVSSSPPHQAEHGSKVGDVIQEGKELYFRTQLKRVTKTQNEDNDGIPPTKMSRVENSEGTYTYACLDENKRKTITNIVNLIQKSSENIINIVANTTKTQPNMGSTEKAGEQFATNNEETNRTSDEGIVPSVDIKEHLPNPDDRSILDRTISNPDVYASHLPSNGETPLGSFNNTEASENTCQDAIRLSQTTVTLTSNDGSGNSKNVQSSSNAMKSLSNSSSGETNTQKPDPTAKRIKPSKVSSDYNNHLLKEDIQIYRDKLFPVLEYARGKMSHEASDQESIIADFGRLAFRETFTDEDILTCSISGRSQANKTMKKFSSIAISIIAKLLAFLNKTEDISWEKFEEFAISREKKCAMTIKEFGIFRESIMIKHANYMRTKLLADQDKVSTN